MHAPSPLPSPAAALTALVLSWVALSAQAQTAWLFGEQHDQRDHQRQVAQAVQQLAQEKRLHAVVLEMAERGNHTAGLLRDAGEAEVQAALRWAGRSWPWDSYRLVVMNAVAAGVPVHGGDLPRDLLRGAMREPKWDGAVPSRARAQLIEAVHEGHCGLLPESQLAPMVRMQLARDRSLAETLAEAARGASPDKVIVMLSGAVHASRSTGVPLQLPAVAPHLKVRSIGFRAAGEGASPALDGFDELRPARHEPGKDHCAELRGRGMPVLPPLAPAQESVR